MPTNQIGMPDANVNLVAAMAAEKMVTEALIPQHMMR
ncbi:hypothetical protein DFP85_11426 [Halomonas ventosae]|uniref:Uncharacterized protein n=1 Tax=Halomonas ventosae TaxID=229007 RepID=A0A4R6ZIH7_9GAMM|nr:hypothetical protein DFP85_11426 [Halomonas ventosae]